MKDQKLSDLLTNFSKVLRNRFTGKDNSEQYMIHLVKTVREGQGFRDTKHGNPNISVIEFLIGVKNFFLSTVGRLLMTVSQWLQRATLCSRAHRRVASGISDEYRPIEWKSASATRSKQSGRRNYYHGY
jgi:hypothetical protein